MRRTSAKGTVVVIDDDEAIRDSMAALLASAGFRVGTYGSGREFLESHDRPAAMCLVIDCQMPDVDGLELIDRLASEGAPAPVVLMTGNCGPSIKARARRAGAVAILEKPFTEELLLSAIHRALG